jgi:hypothetical protein
LQQNGPHGYHYHTYNYIRPYEQVRFDDAPEPIYGFTLRTRQLFPCEEGGQDKFSKECQDLEAKGDVVDCQQKRFRLEHSYIKFILKSLLIF